MTWIIHILLGGLAGFLAGKILSGDGYGVLVDIILGLIGGAVGSFLLQRFLHLPSFGYFITALIGALILVWIGRMIKGK